ELTASEAFSLKMPFEISRVRGTIDPLSPLAFMMEIRDSDLNLKKRVLLNYRSGTCADPSAWWQLKKKKTRSWRGDIGARSARVDMTILLLPFNSAEYIKRLESVFADIHAFVLNTK